MKVPPHLLSCVWVCERWEVGSGKWEVGSEKWEVAEVRNEGTSPPALMCVGV
jgi:hypothetical protein